MSRQAISKSTKRRRFLEEVEVVDLYRVNETESNSQFSRYDEISNEASGSSNITNIPNTSEKIPDTVNSYFNLPIVDDLPLNTSESDDDMCSDAEAPASFFNFFKNDKDCIINSIVQWAVTYNITNTALSALLKVLKVHKCFSEFPVDARTVLKTNVSKINIQTEIQSVHPGIYYHFGVENGLTALSSYLNFTKKNINIFIGIDGLPLTKSSSSTFWPILGSVENKFVRHPIVFLIGLYWGKDKPKDSNLFLKDLVDELIKLSQNGIKISDDVRYVNAYGFCCDAPAKSFVLKTKGHTGFFSCSKCTTEGVYLENRVCFPNTEFTKRTHNGFLLRLNEEYHVTDTMSLITKVPHIDIINSFPLDYMHLVCLGVMKKLIFLWLGNLKHAPLSVRLQSKNVTTISNHLLLLKSFITYDFSRVPRSLLEVARWKATEFRLFLLYTGPVVLKSILTDECYSHFICLHVSFRILLDPYVKNDELINFCDRVLTYFVKKFGKLYGNQFISHNVHGLLHVVDDFKKYGALDKCSCFPFENYLKNLKKMVRKSEKPLEQVIKRYTEYLTFCEPNISVSQLPNKIEFKTSHNDGPLLEGFNGLQFKSVIINDIKINTQSISNCYIGFIKQDKLTICKVINIIKKNNDESVFIINLFDHIKPFYEKPINSLKLGIAVVDNLSSNYYSINIQTSKFKKYMLLNTTQNVRVAFPILHH